MKPLIFHGYSDDTFGEYGRTNEDYDNCASGKPIVFRVSASDGALYVFGQYAPGPAEGWVVGVGPVGDLKTCDAAPLPTWPMRLRGAREGETSYSAVLEIDAPADAKVEHVPGERRAA